MLIFNVGDPSLEGPNEGSSAVVLRNQDSAVAKLKDSAAGVPFSSHHISLTIDDCAKGEFLQARSYQGLETRVGEDAPSVLEQGRSGIARGYQDDHRR
jgi:diphthamide biosynthesis protein 2